MDLPGARIDRLKENLSRVPATVGVALVRRIFGKANIGGYPSLGSWVTYGLGSDNKNLPGYVLLRDASIPPGGIENFSNGFLPGTPTRQPTFATREYPSTT